MQGQVIKGSGRQNILSSINAHKKDLTLNHDNHENSSTIDVFFIFLGKW